MRKVSDSDTRKEKNMALPQDGQNANGLTKVTEVPEGHALLVVELTTNEGKVIALEDLVNQMLDGLTTKIFSINKKNITVIDALNELYNQSPSDGKIWFYASNFEQGTYNASGQKTDNDYVIRTINMTDVSVGDTVHITPSDNQLVAISNYYDGSMHDIGYWVGTETEYTIDHAGKIIVLVKKADGSKITPSEYVRQVYIMRGA